MKPDYLEVCRSVREGEYTDGEIRQIYRFIVEGYMEKNRLRWRQQNLNPVRLTEFVRVTISESARPKEMAGAKGIYLRGVGRQNYAGRWTGGLVLLDENEAYGKYSGDIIRINPQALTMEAVV